MLLQGHQCIYQVLLRRFGKIIPVRFFFFVINFLEDVNSSFSIIASVATATPATTSTELRRQTRVIDDVIRGEIGR